MRWAASRRSSRQQQAQEFMALLMRFYKSVDTALEEGEAPQLILKPQAIADQAPDYPAWCDGYILGWGLSTEEWLQPGNEVLKKLTFPILLLSGAFKEDAERGGREFMPDDEYEKLQQECMDVLPGAVAGIYNFWQARRKGTTVKREGPRWGATNPARAAAARNSSSAAAWKGHYIDSKHQPAHRRRARRARSPGGRRRGPARRRLHRALHLALPQGSDRRARRYPVAQSRRAPALPARAGGAARGHPRQHRQPGQADAGTGKCRQPRGNQGRAGRPLPALQAEAPHQGADRPRGRAGAAGRRAAGKPRAGARRRCRGLPQCRTGRAGQPRPRSTARATS